MTVREIKEKARRNGDTKSYRLILADLNGVPIRVINAILDSTLIPHGYMIENDEIKVTKRYLYSGATVKTLERKDHKDIVAQIEREKSTIRGLRASMDKVKGTLKQDKTLLQTLKRDLSTEEKKLEELEKEYDRLHSS